VFTDTTYIIIKLKGTTFVQVGRRNAVNVWMEIVYCIGTLYAHIEQTFVHINFNYWSFN